MMYTRVVQIQNIKLSNFNLIKQKEYMNVNVYIIKQAHFLLHYFSTS